MPQVESDTHASIALLLALAALTPRLLPLRLLAPARLLHASPRLLGQRAQHLRLLPGAPHLDQEERPPAARVSSTPSRKPRKNPTRCFTLAPFGLGQGWSHD